MNFQARAASALFACALSLGLTVGMPANGSAATAVQNINITASTGKFTPGVIIVHAGQPVALHLTSAAGVHGIESSDFGIPMTMITPGSDKTVTFTPEKVGTYVIHCAIMCGPDHANMKFVVKVEA